MTTFQYIIIFVAVICFVAGVIAIIHPGKKTLEAIHTSDRIKEKDFADMTYSEFSLFIFKYDLTPFIYYDDFEIYYIDGRYFYYECESESDSDEFYEVKPIAILEYADTDDLLIKDGCLLSTLFECDCCGEAEDDDGIYYCWFKKAGDEMGD